LEDNALSIWTEYAYNLVANGATWREVEEIYIALAASISHTAGLLIG
jgi:hypothetical protein